MIRNKLFVIRKYVFAKSASEAILKSVKSPVDDVWVDDEWKKMNEGTMTKLDGAMGFTIDKKNE